MKDKINSIIEKSKLYNGVIYNVSPPVIMDDRCFKCAIVRYNIQIRLHK